MDLYDTLKYFLIVSLVFIPLEKIIPQKANQAIFRKGWSNDLAHVFLTGLMVSAGILLIAIVTSYLLENIIPIEFSAAIADQPIWLQFIEVLIIADIGFYWVHRAFHEIPCLWRLHTIHHSIKELDYLAAHRVHPIDQILTRGVTLIPVLSLGYDVETLALFSLFYRWHSLLIHSNTKIEFGILKWVIASPRFHHWHHANHTEAMNKNYAGQLSILDTIFGSLHLPKNEMPLRYGIDEVVPGSYLGQMIFPFQKSKNHQPTESIGKPNSIGLDIKK
jgi:sterol desaturase/sphingolipid hydroxylase (fatty acid hydroxylase superfamily)